jgi:hypothetical protein
MAITGNESVPSGPARAIRRKRGSNITIVNQSAVDVYYSYNASDLNSAPDGTAPVGPQKIAASGGELVVTAWPDLAFWVRAVSDTFLSVQP